jgi:hypothetical protein
MASAAPISDAATAGFSEMPCIRGFGETQLLPVASIEGNGLPQTSPLHAVDRADQIVMWCGVIIHPVAPEQ